MQEAERCGTSPFPYAYHSLPMCVLRTLFLLDLLFPTASVRVGLREPAAVGLGLSVLIEQQNHVVHRQAFDTHAAAEQDPTM